MMNMNSIAKREVEDEEFQFRLTIITAHENARIWCQHQGTFFLT